uniref:Transmembrane protein 256 homolog n=1 Tax=Rhizophora mucronata TaxID=61149 RepID=A0A2P2JM18_RHIMU
MIANMKKVLKSRKREYLDDGKASPVKELQLHKSTYWIYHSNQIMLLLLDPQQSERSPCHREIPLMDECKRWVLCTS